MSPNTNNQRLRWWYTLAMLGVYLAVFHIWMPFARGHAALFGLVASFGLFAGALEARRRGYFVNNYDFGFHGIVVLDVVLEGLLVPVHAGYGFYWCALAFAVAIGGYRTSAWRKRREDFLDSETKGASMPGNVS